MTDGKSENKEKPKLSLTGKLTLSAKPSTESAAVNIVARKKNVTVEVKKNRFLSKKPSESDAAGDAGGLTNAELKARMEAFQAAKAGQDKSEGERSKSLLEELREAERAERATQITVDQEGKDKDTEVTPPQEKVFSEEELREQQLELQVAETRGEKTSKVEVKVKKASDNEEEPDFEEEAETKAKKSVKRDVKVVKNRYEEGRRQNSKINIALVEQEQERVRSLASIKRAREKAKRAEQMAPAEKISREVILPETITVQELATRMAERGADVVKELMKLGVLAKLTQVIDADTAELVAVTMGHSVKRVSESDVENVIADQEDTPESMTPRPPVVTVMGHVDHGKTSLLDAIKQSNVVQGEAGGITQHIGAYQVSLPDGQLITFLDTPGHEAFTAMRSRGAKATDIVILVVAADDGIMAQTVEAINHAKAAKVPIIVAVNKIDLPQADLNRVKTELLSHELVPEDMGGDIMVVGVSALKKTNIDKLLEGVLLQAGILELKARKDRAARGVVIESRLDVGRGNVATLLVQKGTLKPGDIIVAGQSFGKIRSLYNDKGELVKEAIPSDPIEVVGLNTCPEAGELFASVSNEKQARDIVEYRINKAKELKSVAERKGTSLEDLFTKSGGSKELNLVIKGDVQGSVEAIIGSLQKIKHEEVSIKVLHSGVGGINESDVGLAKASNAIIVGFNVRATAQARRLAEMDHIDIRYYSIIYQLIDEVKAALSGLLSTIKKEEYLGTAEIRQVFNITKVGKVAGAYVTDGLLRKAAKVRLLRDNVVIHEGKLKTLRRFKDDVKEVKSNFECGIALENYDDIKMGDFIEAFEITEIKQELE